MRPNPGKWVAAVALAAGGFARQASRVEPEPATFTLSGRVVDLRGEGVPAAVVWVGPCPGRSSTSSGGALPASGRWAPIA